METLDLKTALRTTLTQKQEMVRDYQTFASQIQDKSISELFRTFAETEALDAAKIRDTLNELS